MSSSSKPPCHKVYLRNRGFTLTEMAVVLVIISLLIGGLLMPLGSQQDIRANHETQDRLAEAKEALMGYAVANGRLPCPATAISNGAESPVTGGICNAAATDSYLPAATLGLAPVDSQGRLMDAWGFPIRYYVTSANSSAFTTVAGMKTQTISALIPDLKVYTDHTLATSLTTNAIAVLYSTGKTGGSGPLGDDEKENPNAASATIPDPTPNAFVSHLPTPDFDDVLIWITPNILYSRMISAGQLP